jgi:hypothetical protein
VILIDQCKDPIFLQAGFLKALPHLLISERPVYSNSLESNIMHISELQSGSKIMINEIAKCIRSFKRPEYENPLSCVIPAIPTGCDKVILSRFNDSIYLNGIEAIRKKRAKVKFDLICIFIDAFMDDFKKEKNTYLNVHQISDKLVKCGHDISCNHENRIRQMIRKIQISFQEITNTEIISNVYLSGYRLNIENILLKIQRT